MNQRDWDLLNKQLGWMQPPLRQISLKFGVTCALVLAGLGVSSIMVLHDPNSTLTTTARSPHAILTAYNAPQTY